MAQFRSKPRTIEAEQFLPCESEPRGICRQAHDYRPHVHTMHQNQIVYLELGDWIVQEPDGIHYYPIRDDIFRANYEPVAQKLNWRSWADAEALAKRWQEEHV